MVADVSYRVRCEGRRARRRVVAYGRLRRSHERTFRALEAMRPPPSTGDALADMWAAEMFGAGQQMYRSMCRMSYFTFQTWEERYRARKGAT